MIDLIKERTGKMFDVNSIREELYSEYAKYVPRLEGQILDIMISQGKKILAGQVKAKKLSFQNLILSESYYLTTIDYYVLANKFQIPLYFINSRRPDLDVFSKNQIENSNDIHTINQNFNRVFFEDNSAWPDNCSRIWDRRERDALNSRPFDSSWRSNIDPMFNKTKKHYHINCLTYWFNGESEILKIMEYLELFVDPDRYTQWKLIYAEWQKIHIKFLDFTFKIDDIIAGIINNWDYEIGSMTYNEETVIQHLILYKHNLNFNTWQLTKFPTNTKDLHKLLIPCVHKLEKLY